MTTDMSCRVCQSLLANCVTWKRFGFNWGTCDVCKTTQKLISEESYYALNPSYDPGMFMDEISSEQELWKVLDVDNKKEILRKYGGGQLQGKRFLDIGCGLGGFMLAAESLGMEANGFEPSRLHCSVLNRVCPNRFKIINDYFDPCKCSDPYDMILLSHVIEHIYTPRIFLEEIISKLAPGGILVVVTPNNQSIETRLTGKRWLMYKPVDHVTMVGPTAAKILAPAESTIVALDTHEYRGEFFVHVMSAIKSSFSSDVPSGILKDAEKPRKQVSARSFPIWLRTLFQVVSLPFWGWGAMTNRLACMTVVYKRNDLHPVA